MKFFCFILGALWSVFSMVLTVVLILAGVLLGIDTDHGVRKKYTPAYSYNEWKSRGDEWKSRGI